MGVDLAGLLGMLAALAVTFGYARGRRPATAELQRSPAASSMRSSEPIARDKRSISYGSHLSFGSRGETWTDSSLETLFISAVQHEAFIAVDEDGNLFIGDSANSRIRKIVWR